MYKRQTLDIAVGGVGYILRCHAELDGRQAAQLFFDVLAGLQHRIAGVEGGARGRGGLIIGSNGGIHQMCIRDSYYPFDLESEEAIYRKCY